MNMIDSQCIYCSRHILVNSKEAKDLTAHVCSSCLASESGITQDNFMNLYSNSHEIEIDDTEITEFPDDEMDELENLYNNYRNSYISPKPKCECGAKVVGTPFHSDWCPIYKDPKGED